MSDLSMRLKKRARVLAAGVALSAATLVILPGVAEACDSTSCDGGGSPSGSLTNSFGDQEANLTSEQSNTQEQDSTQVSLANAAVSTPIAVGIGGDATNEDSGANAGNFSEQNQWASNESTQEADQEQNAGGSYSKDCSTGCSTTQPTNDFGDQSADLSSKQHNYQEQDNFQLSGINAAVSAPVAVGVLGDATNEDSGANAGNFSEQNQWASNKSTQEVDQEQNAGKSYSKDYSNDCSNDCSSKQPTNDFGDQSADLSSKQSNKQEQDNTQLSGINAAVSAPIAVGIGGDATNEDSGANAGNFSEQDQRASNKSTQEVDQEQNAGKSYSKSTNNPSGGGDGDGGCGCPSTDGDDNAKKKANAGNGNGPEGNRNVNNDPGSSQDHNKANDESGDSDGKDNPGGQTDKR
jgi:hypothetical protein